MSFGLNATQLTGAVCPDNSTNNAPVWASQTRTVPSSPPETIRVPVWLKATVMTRPTGPVSVWTSGSPVVVRSQTRTVASNDPDTRRWPSGENATHSTTCVCPVSVLTLVLLCKSQTEIL